MLTQTSTAGTAPFLWDTYLDSTVFSGYFAHLQVATDSGFVSVTQDMTQMITPSDLASGNIVFSGFTTPSGTFYVRMRIWDGASVYSSWSNTLAETITLTLPGSQAFRFFADDLANLKQNIAGSTAVAADGDPVGKWLDQSGNSYHLAAAADNSTRPTYHVRSGKGYVAGDGVDDLLYSTTAPNLYGATGNGTFTIALSFRWTSPVGAKTVIDESDANSNTSIGSYVRSLSTTPADMSSSIRGSDGSTNAVTNTNTFLSNANNGVDHTLIYVRNGAVLTPYLDGVAQATEVVSSTNFVGNQLNLFGRYRNRLITPNIDAWAAVDIYGAVSWQSDRTADVATIHAILAALHP
ncbi:MAG: hypothetical protein E6Q97_23025 [Desulfurellales bacterium]|nr:MAG: hypothetical protein E6Q97_23025 [Desulfurellales bacterium]